MANTILEKLDTIIDILKGNGNFINTENTALSKWNKIIELLSNGKNKGE